MNCIIAMLHDYAHSRWHPIAFRHNPRPSEDGKENCTRYKSQGHHNVGFPNREEALQFARNTMTEWANNKFSHTYYCLDKDFPWDGSDTPVMVVHFTVGENPVPVF